MTSVPAIILAAGKGRRMGLSKALLRIRKKILLEDQIDRLAKAGCKPIIAVLNGGPDQFSSLKCGLKTLKSYSNGCLILPVDVPFVPVGVIKKIIQTAKNKYSAVVPNHRANKGHPIWISERLIKKICGKKMGRLDQIIQSSDNVAPLFVKSASILNNVNTPKDWQRLLTFLTSRQR